MTYTHIYWRDPRAGPTLRGDGSRGLPARRWQIVIVVIVVVVVVVL